MVGNHAVVQVSFIPVIQLVIDRTQSECRFQTEEGYFHIRQPPVCAQPRVLLPLAVSLVRRGTQKWRHCRLPRRPWAVRHYGHGIRPIRVFLDDDVVLASDLAVRFLHEIRLGEVDMKFGDGFPEALPLGLYWSDIKKKSSIFKNCKWLRKHHESNIP